MKKWEGLKEDSESFCQGVPLAPCTQLME